MTLKAKALIAPPPQPVKTTAQITQSPIITPTPRSAKAKVDQTIVSLDTEE
ncbi:hypothetical protein Pint_06548 [Pistacia integerrima]|uniref:Uncharacterized protein n=1 Tax=Pistacia integerrima TaxID=434235 RepID=A0ACC0Z6S0_9ROSI|nr:hypothetical protein Pint_06548 [Pistacia integerrima]